jgi:hypothetical protein
VAELLRRSLRLLLAEVPDSHRHLVATLGTLTVEVTVDGETFQVRTDRVDVLVADGGAPGGAAVRVRASWGAVRELLDGRRALAEAVESDRVRVDGTLDDVVRAHDVLLAYAHAAVRAPSGPGLLHSLDDAPRGAR